MPPGGLFLIAAEAFAVGDLFLDLLTFVGNHAFEVLAHVFNEDRETLTHSVDLLNDEGVDVTGFLGIVDFIEGDEDAGFFCLAEFMVDTAAEHLHGRRQAHV